MDPLDALGPAELEWLRNRDYFARQEVEALGQTAFALDIVVHTTEKNVAGRDIRAESFAQAKSRLLRVRSQIYGLARIEAISIIERLD